MQEVRRFYPFFPAVPARVHEDFEWRGYRLRAGTLALLDLYGTDHDERIWDDPRVFRPERFVGWRDDGFSLVAQGAGDPASGHRCAGEPVTSGLLLRALRFLVNDVEYAVPPQDLRIDFQRLPALPRSRMLLGRVRLR